MNEKITKNKKKYFLLKSMFKVLLDLLKSDFVSPKASISPAGISSWKTIMYNHKLKFI